MSCFAWTIYFRFMTVRVWRKTPISFSPRTSKSSYIAAGVPTRPSVYTVNMQRKPNLIYKKMAKQRRRTILKLEEKMRWSFSTHPNCHKKNWVHTEKNISCLARIYHCLTYINISIREICFIPPGFNHPGSGKFEMPIWFNLGLKKKKDLISHDF